MERTHHINVYTARVYAVLIGLLAAVGIFNSGLLAGLMNVDLALDLIRLVLFGALVYAGFILSREDISGSVLMVVGLLYIGMGIVGVFSSTLGGILPSGLTGLDIAFHLLTGILAVSISAWNTDAKKLVHS